MAPEPETTKHDLGSLASQVEELLEQGQSTAVSSLLAPLHPTDIADVIDRLPDELKPKLFDVLDDVDRAADVMLELDEESLRVILAELDSDELTGLLREMDSDDATDVVARLEDRARSDAIRDLPEQDRSEVTELLKYPDSSAGGIMRMEFVSLAETDTIASATDKVRHAERHDVEPPVLYTVDPAGRLVGYVSLRDLLRYPPDTPVTRIMRPAPAAAGVLQDQEEVAELARKYDLSTVPVVDKSGRLAGVVTSDEILDVVVEEASEDIAKLGQADLEQALSSVRRSVRGRVPWLFVSLLGGLLASFVVLFFKGTLESLVVIAAFMPIVAGMGGAAGNQATNIVVRSLALGEIGFSDIGRLLWKQIRVGLVAGSATGTLAALVALALQKSPLLGAVVLLAMVLNVTIGSTLGATTPLVLARLRKDPALASSLLLTATTDMVGLFILLGLASLALRFFRF